MSFAARHWYRLSPVSILLVPVGLLFRFLAALRRLGPTVHHRKFFAPVAALLQGDLPLSFAQLALGAEIEVPALEGTDRLKIPAGTQPHQVLRLRGKGMPRLRERGHGDACYRVVLEVPQKLNARQREALEAFETASKDHRGPLASAFLERMKKLLG